MLFSYNCNNQFSGTAVVAELAEVDPLPGAKVQTAIGDGNGDADTAQRVLRTILRHEAIEDGFHIDANIRVAVLVDAQSATGMFREDGHDARLRQFRQLTHYLARHQMEATTFRLQGYFNLLYHTGCKGTNKNRYVEISLLSFRENPPPDYDFSFVNTKKNAVLCTEKKK